MPDMQHSSHCEVEKMIYYEKTNLNFRNKKTTDCVVRAITAASGKKYNEILDMLIDEYKRSGNHIADPKNYSKVISELGFIKYAQPKKWDKKKYRIDEIEKVADADTLIISDNKHLTCIKTIDHRKFLIDTWDCRNKYIRNYWIKKEVKK